MELPEILELTIEDLRLQGFTNIDEQSVATAVQDELQHLLLTEKVSLENLMQLAGTIPNYHLYLEVEPALSCNALGKKIAHGLFYGATKKDLTGAA